ncbi:MAG: hypothetical protein IJA87_07205 [Clostridia bacterium]|nr:hypothetical protein [Clostridia bacterium]
MIDFEPVKNPNLPKGRVLHVVASGQYPHFVKELEKCGVDVLITDSCPDIISSLRYHADMLFAYLGNRQFVIEKTQNCLKKRLESLGFFSLNKSVSLGNIYPNDIALNACIIDDKVVCGKEGVHTAIKNNRDIIEVSQGYAKCSVCVVDENSLITDDVSIYKACISVGLDVLLVSKGSVDLDGFDYGFIGGCCGKISEDTMAFCGDLNTHSDCAKIKSFLSLRNVYPISLGSGKLTDIGSLLPITQYI